MHQIPGMPNEPSLAEHGMQMRWGAVNDVRVLLFAGRFHYYEGHGCIPCVLPVWAAVECGARNFLFCNAAGGIAEGLTPGDMMLVSDHVNHIGVSPLAGHQHLLESAFADMSQVYDHDLRQTLRQAADAAGIELAAGTYAANCGPQFETPAEIASLAQAGVDAVGMSTVLEATVAHANQARVAALSLITNSAAGRNDAPLTHAQTLAASQAAVPMLQKLLRRWLQHEAVGTL